MTDESVGPPAEERADTPKVCPECGKGPGVYAAIAAVMGEVGRIPKAGRNDFHGYDYATETDIMDAVRPLMAKHGLVCIPTQGEREEIETKTSRGKPTKITRIRHVLQFVSTADGSEVFMDVWGEGEDASDKGGYKAFTGAMKYALMKLFLLGTGDDPERDSKRVQASENGKGGKAEESTDPITTEQLATLREHLSHRLVTDAERARFEKIIDEGLTEVRGAAAIEFWKGELEKREKNEVDAEGAAVTSGESEAEEAPAVSSSAEFEQSLRDDPLGTGQPQAEQPVEVAHEGDELPMVKKARLMTEVEALCEEGAAGGTSYAASKALKMFGNGKLVELEIGQLELLLAELRKELVGQDSLL